jgi:deoxycytidylate deaminase
VFIDKDKFGKDKWKTLYTEYTPTITAQVDIVTRNIKKIVKSKPWSALNGRVTRGSQLSLSAHKDLPLPATTPLTR